MQAQRPNAKTFRDLLVWEKAHEFVLEVYRYTEWFPQREIYGLVLKKEGCISWRSQPPAECICKGDSGFWLLTPGFYPAAFGGCCLLD